MDVLDFLDALDNENCVNRYIERVFRDRTNPFDSLTEDDFFGRYRFHKETVSVMADMLRHELEYSSNRNQALSPEQQLLTTLRYYGNGTFQREVGDIHGVSQPTVSRVVHKVSDVIASLAPRYIRFPRVGEVGAEKRAFYQTANFPGTVGAIDCTHIAIDSPGGLHAELFRNRKGVFSINTQVVCNSKMEVTNIVARWPGSTHDSRIFTNSSLAENMQGNLDGGHLVGDQGYPCCPYLLTPLGTTRNRAESRYNRALSKTRCIIERFFGQWKRRFPRLKLGMGFKPERCCVIITACAVLHNIGCINNEPAVLIEDDDLEDDDDHSDELENARGNAKRRTLIDNHFA